MLSFLLGFATSIDYAVEMSECDKIIHKSSVKRQKYIGIGIACPIAAIWLIIMVFVTAGSS